MDETKKNIDESWKDSVDSEKKEIKKPEGPDNEALPEADFSFFVTTLGLQAGIFLGEIPNPATGKKEENITQAKFIVDTLGMLQEKTKNNLTDEESQLLENILYELRMQYVAKTKGKV